MNQEQLKNIVEAALMVSEKPVSLAQLSAIFENESDIPEKADIKTAIDQITEDYKGRGIELNEVASGFRVQVNSDYAEWINHLFDDRPPRYSRALLETLAIIAYRQPMTRAEIEEIRGVSVSSNIIRTLQERNWIRVVGQRDIPGKPELLATTKEFLDYFNLKKLSELPSLSEIKDFDQINPDLFEELEKEAKVQVDKAAAGRLDAAKPDTTKLYPNVEQVETDDSESIPEPEADKSKETHNVVSDEDNVVPFG
ncbi:MAG: segregation and condensation protein B [Gammaproteobacteria bacterium]|jgi:segregation and condensation protein B